MERTAWNCLYQATQGVILVEASFHAESPILIDSDSIKLTFIICAIMVHYEKRLTKIKQCVQWDSNHQPHALRVYGCLNLCLLGTSVKE